MAAELLHCCICPKRPDFSDTSHLLTHVGSKGHLSHLHKLQVKSHQEPMATQQLAIYNQWFAAHNVAQLLSERMQMKESKQSKRRVGNERRSANTVRNNQSNVDPELLSTYAPSSTTTNRSWLYASSGTNDVQVQSPEGNEDAGLEAARLKGMIWPGMDIFDSADEMTQRKRNQRKDGSVLKKMQAMSELVEPLETVCSPSGTVKKRRHIDELEDDSPVEGESPPTKMSTKRKRAPLRAVNNNLSRPITHRPRRTLYTPTKATHTISRPYMNRENRGSELISNHPAIRSFGYNAMDNSKENDFAIFGDESLDTGRGLPDTLYSNPFRTGSPLQFRSRAHAFVSPDWPQTSYQLDHEYNPFREYRTMRLASGACFNSTDDKENENPLCWGENLGNNVRSPTPTTLDHFDSFEDTLGSLAKVYAFTRNPLAISTPKHKIGIRDTPINSMSRRQQPDQKPVLFR